MIDTRHPLPRGALAAAVVGAVLVAGLGIAAVRSPEPETAAGPYAQFCTPFPPEAAVAAATPADHRIRVSVPLSVRAPDLEGRSHATQLIRGEVVEFEITAPIAGAAQVHGLSDLLVMRAGEPVTLRFRAIHSGRFPLHFHGADGSHYGVWALNISAPPR